MELAFSRNTPWPLMARTVSPEHNQREREREREREIEREREREKHYKTAKFLQMGA